MISELCTCSIDGVIDVVLKHDGDIEAPNWHPDGYLVVNGGGQIFRVALDNPQLELIDTGFAQNCNNDHGISPNWQLLAISDASQTNGSCIYTVPIGGGSPRRITPKTPSWWHGWSPDGASLAYVGARDGGPVKLYCMPSGGGDETLVCDGFDHVDGPDYTADGQWIWFNGERAGDVNLWRVRPDGCDLTQMTFDETVNWFPHPSPNGAHVVYLAYPKGTKGHPGGLQVALRIMPSGGGEAQTLVSLLGGQGTINVPSWAPDAKRFAFVRYSD